jgi:NADPH:quinone reductase
MRAFVPTQAGVPSVELAEVDEPEAAFGELIVAVEAFSPNRGETFLLEDPPPGWRPGKDVAGIVVRAAESGKGPGVGQRVVAHPEHSGWAERVAVSLDKVTALPADVPFTTAAALPLAGLTALRLTRVTGPLASRRLLLTGASGGVGHYFVELAAAQGGDITVVTASEERGVRLLELGATSSVRRVADASEPYQIGLESVGGDVTAAVWEKLTDDGLLVWFGQASRVPPTLDFFDWRGGSSGTIRKFAYFDSDTTDADDLATLVRLVQAGRLHPEIGLVADWEHTAEAIQTVMGRSVRGNAVLTLPSSSVARAKSDYEAPDDDVSGNRSGAAPPSGS